MVHKLAAKAFHSMNFSIWMKTLKWELQIPHRVKSKQNSQAVMAGVQLDRIVAILPCLAPQWHWKSSQIL